MTKIYRSAISLLMVIILMMGLTVNAFAADSSVVYRGKEDGFKFSPGSEYTDTDLFDNFKGMMPGQSRTEEITIKNESTDSDYIKLYLRAIPHDEVENPISDKVAEAGVDIVTMADFMSHLSMKVWNGDPAGTPIYDASPDELDGLSENVLLGEFESGESTVLTVQLEVPPTLGNEFQGFAGEVDWVFTVEMFDYPEPVVNESLTVNKIWKDDGSGRPENIKVDLLRDGEYFTDITLSADNQWTYTWNELDNSFEWTVVESNVPEGYTASYNTNGNVVTITNTADKAPVPPTEKYTELTVKKEWSGDEERLSDRPDSVEVTLYNGSTAIETILLGNWNNWEYTWTKLSADGNWKVLETNIPNGYTPKYSTDGTTVTITNIASLIQTGQMKWPIPVLFGLGITMIAFGGIVIAKKRKQNETVE